MQKKMINKECSMRQGTPIFLEDRSSNDDARSSGFEAIPASNKAKNVL
jgi:hypothetical protein